jgi:hypothetical protein
VRQKHLLDVPENLTKTYFRPDQRLLKFNFKDPLFSGLMQVIFKSVDFFPMIRQQQLTALDVVSYCGGSLGLFLGFSALSAIEIVYYLTLRSICVKRQQLKVSIATANNESIKKNYLAEFSESSTVHGFNQVNMRSRHFIERFSINFLFLI